MQVITDFPERLTVGSRVYLGDRHEPATIGSKREHPEGMVIRFKGIDSPEAAAGHRQQEVFVKSADRPELPAGMYYHHELIGFAVHDEGGVRLGTLREIMQTGANDVYVVAQSDGGEVLLPAIAPVILGIDTERKEIRVRAIPGLLEGTRTGKSNR